MKPKIIINIIWYAKGNDLLYSLFVHVKWLILRKRIHRHQTRQNFNSMRYNTMLTKVKLIYRCSIKLLDI